MERRDLICLMAAEILRTRYKAFAPCAELYKDVVDHAIALEREVESRQPATEQRPLNGDDDSVAHSWDTEPVAVTVDVDRGIAPLVRAFNKIPGVRTFASCEGHPHSTIDTSAYVMLHMPPESIIPLAEELETLVESQQPQPKCAGYPACDGNLPGEPHEPECPSRQPQEAAKDLPIGRGAYAAGFNDARDKAIQAVRELTPTDTWMIQISVVQAAIAALKH